METEDGNRQRNCDRAEWESLLHAEGLAGWIEKWSCGAWSRHGNAVLGNLKSDTIAQVRTGDAAWSDYEVSVTGALIKGSNLQIVFRVSNDGASFYAFDWGNVGKVALSRFSPDSERVILSFVDYPIEIGREYHIVVAVHGQVLTTSIDGNPVHELTDGAYRTGGIGFSMWHKAQVTFKESKDQAYWLGGSCMAALRFPVDCLMRGDFVSRLWIPRFLNRASAGMTIAVTLVSVWLLDSRRLHPMRWRPHRRSE